MSANTETLKYFKALKVTHYILTILLVLDVLMAGLAFIASTLTTLPQITDTFVRLGYPIYIVPLLGLLKIGAVVAIIKGGTLREWAHFGLFFMFLLAFYSHLGAGDGFADSFPALLAFILNLASYFVNKRIKAN